MERQIEVLAEWAWAKHKGMPAAPQPKTDWRNGVAKTLRPVTGWLYCNIWRGVLVPVLGIVIGVIALIVLSPFWIWRVFRRRPWMA